MLLFCTGPGGVRMPFRSAKQRRFMYKRHPKIAKRWSKRYGSRVRKKGRRR